jgi:hypothetical protein
MIKKYKLLLLDSLNIVKRCHERDAILDSGEEVRGKSEVAEGMPQSGAVGRLCLRKTLRAERRRPANDFRLEPAPEVIWSFLSAGCSRRRGSSA